MGIACAHGTRARNGADPVARMSGQRREPTEPPTARRSSATRFRLPGSRRCRRPGAQLTGNRPAGLGKRAAGASAEIWTGFSWPASGRAAGRAFEKMIVVGWVIWRCAPRGRRLRRGPALGRFAASEQPWIVVTIARWMPLRPCRREPITPNLRSHPYYPTLLPTTIPSTLQNDALGCPAPLASA